MAWVLLIGSVVCAWALLSALSAERERRMRTVELESTLRRHAAARAAAAAVEAAKKSQGVAVAGTSGASGTTGNAVPAPPRGAN